ncbi:MAG TPA: tripartite tricarboxylate transporter substrate binding protein [Burkholderiales bacterium]|nr:tripartite tricarboxylate transporter substrate binding protein [Burkholderiales bacterium]
MNAARVLLSACLLSLSATAIAAAAQAYPSRPIRAIVPFPPGGPTDVIARLVGQKLSESFGQQVVVDNRSGAGGNIGMGIAAQAAPDGHTLIFVSSSFVANPSLYRNAPYDPFKSFAPVSNVAASPHAFFAHPSQPVKTMADLVAQVRAASGKYSMATPGMGTTPDLSAHLLKLDAKLQLVLVPYAGGGPSLAAVLGNQVPFGCQAIPPVTAHLKAGRLRGLALTSARRSAVLPDVPTMAEAGFKGHEAETMTALLVPAGTPPAIVNKLHAEVARIMKLPDVRDRVIELGYNIHASTPQAFAAQIRAEVEKWGKVVRAANIQVN